MPHVTENHTAMVRRITAAFRRASAEDLADGLSWYARAESLSRALAAGTPYHYTQAAGVIAALSPRVQWDQNAAGAAAMMDAAVAGAPEPIVAGMEKNRGKAWRILADHGTDPLDVLGGPKVRRFYRNITGDLDAVTVDVWAARAATGVDLDGITVRQYERIERAYQRAAEILGVTPREAQAAVWVYIRRTWKEAA